MKFSKLIKKDVEKEVKEVKKFCHITPKFLRHKWLAVYSLGLLLSHLALGLSYYSGSSLISETPESMAKNIISLSNEKRSENELGTLTENTKLDNAAKDKLNDMFASNYWDHYSPSGKKPWDFIVKADYKYVYAGENLAKGFLDSKSAVDAWMKSQSHKDNILSSRYKEIGVAVGSGTIDGKPTTLVVQMFGSPEVDTVAPTVAKANEQQKVVVASAVNVKGAQFSPNFTTIWSRIPFFAIWFVIFCLIVFDGTVIRRCGLHASRRHMFEFRSALLINALVLIALSINFVAIT